MSSTSNSAKQPLEQVVSVTVDNDSDNNLKKGGVYVVCKIFVVYFVVYFIIV